MARKYSSLLPDDARMALKRERDGIISKAKDAKQRKRWLDRFDNDPRVLELQQIADRPVPVTTREEDIRKVARDRLLEGGHRDPVSDFAGSFASSVGNLFGVADRVAALPASLLTGRGYDETFRELREQGERTRSRSTVGNILGQLYGPFGAAKFGAAGVGRIAEGSGRAAQAARAAQAIAAPSTKAGAGARAANIGRFSAAGATGGAAQAAGEGSDIGTGAAIGAAAGPAVVGAVKLAGAGRNFIRNITRPFSGSVEKALKEVVEEAPDTVNRNVRELSRKTGRPVPVVAALRERDFNKVVDDVLRKSPEASEVAERTAKGEAKGFMSTLLSHVTRAGRKAGAEETTVGKLSDFRRSETSRLMKPIENKQVDLREMFGDLDGMQGASLKDIGLRVRALAPAIREASSSPDNAKFDALGLTPHEVDMITTWFSGEADNIPVNITVRQADTLRRLLSASAKGADNLGNAADANLFRETAQDVRKFVEKAHPEYGNVVDTFAAQSRVLEGFNTAKKGQRIDDIENDLLRDNLRTPEGRAGLKAGELFRLRSQAGQSTSQATSLARELGSGGELTRPLSRASEAGLPGRSVENLGDPRAAARLSEQAGAEFDTLQKLLKAGGVTARQLEGRALDDPETLAFAAALIPSGALPSTIARFAASLVGRKTALNEDVAADVARMLFSRDPEISRQAISFLNQQGVASRVIASILDDALPASAIAGQVAVGQNVERGPGEVPQDEPLTDQPEITEQQLEEMSDEELDAYIEQQQGGGEGQTEITEQQLEEMSDEELDAYIEQQSSGSFKEGVPPTSAASSILSIYPEATVTDTIRDPNSALGRANPTSSHNRSEGAVDVRPIPGLSFEQFVQSLKERGLQIIEARDEVNNPAKHATGPHWHVVVGNA